MIEDTRFKIVYCTPALYMAGGVERVLSMKASFFADHFGYDITIILTEGAGKPLFYPLSEKVKVINLNIGFEELWNCSFIKKVFVYLRKQSQYKKCLALELMRIRPDITISLLRREINFINGVKDGSKKVGELHINRANYRNFDKSQSNFFKELFSKYWMYNFVSKLKHLDKFVVLTEKDKEAWVELDNVQVIPNPLSFTPSVVSNQTKKRVIAVGRYCHEKGYDYLLQAWSKVQHICPDWNLAIFGDGERTAYEQMLVDLKIDTDRCTLNGRTNNIQSEYINSSLAVCSSRFEGFGLSIVEAMACGLPVVSFDCPWGPRSIISDGEDGILVEKESVDNLVDNLIKLMQDNTKRKLLSKNASRNVLRFKIEQIALKWKSLFEEFNHAI